MKLILASQSPYKQQQLTNLGIGFESVSPPVNEDHEILQDPEQLALELARQKAASIFQSQPDALIIGSDQTAISPEHQLLTKPGNRDTAIKQLLACSGRTVRFYSAIWTISAHQQASACVMTDANFRSLTLDEITRYVDKDNPLDCAGSFKVESLGISLFRSIQSDDPSALIGLPVIALGKILRQHGVQLP